MEGMGEIMQGSWRILLLRGLLAILLGVFAIVNAQTTAVLLYIWLGVYVIVDGLMKLYYAYRVRKSGQSIWPSILSGLISILAGLAIFAWPKLTVVVLAALVAATAIYQGGTDVVMAFRLRKEGTASRFWLWLAGGGLQVLFGIWMIFQPVLGGLTLIAVIGAYAVVLGVILILKAFQERSGGAGGPYAPA